jgi:hypothetical protein
MEMPRRGAVDNDLSGAARQTDCVRIDANAVIDVPDRHPLAGDDVGPIEQVLVHADAADVIDVGAGDDRAVNLGLEKSA